MCVSLCCYGIVVIEFWLCAVGYWRCEPMILVCAIGVNISLRFELRQLHAWES